MVQLKYTIASFAKTSIKHFALVLICLISLAYTANAQEVAQEKPLTRILFVFDGSQSMFGQMDGKMKIDVAKKLLNELLDSLKYVDHLELALRAYGHQSQYVSNSMRDCKDTKLEVPFYKGNIPNIKNKLQLIQPKGTTPIAYSLEQSAKDFPSCDNCRNIIILITDGIEECDGDPCALSQALQAKGIVLKPFVIGVGLDKDLIKQFECVGNFYDASDTRTFKTALNVVISQALNSTTAQVNLLDVAGNPTETNVNMTFYHSQSSKVLYNFVHTMDNHGNPDTLVIDPLPTYRVVAHTIPPSFVDSVTLTPGKHTIIAIDAPQGDLDLRADGRSDYKELKAIVRKAGEMQTLHVQDFMDKERYIVGKYDLEILTMPRMYVSDVEIKQSHTTKVAIPQPGIANILKQSAGYASVYHEDGNELKLIYNIRVESQQETLVLLPGRYRAVFRPKNSKKSIYTIEKSFKIESGSSEVIKLY